MKIKSTHPASQGAFVEINAEDFNAATMEKYLDGSEESQNADLTTAQIKAQLDTLGIDYKSSAPKAELLEILDAAEAAVK